MFDSLEACTNAWKNAGNHGSQEERIERNLRWMRYYAYVYERQRDVEASIDPHAADVVDTLFRQGLLTPESSVLDVGSGVGAYALAFASRCAEVTALDMELSSLGILQEHAAQLGLNNVACGKACGKVTGPIERFLLCSRPCVPRFAITRSCAVWSCSPGMPAASSP